MLKAFWSALAHCYTIFQEEYAQSPEAKIIKIITAVTGFASLFVVFPGNPITRWAWSWRIAAAAIGLLFVSLAMLVALYRRHSRLIIPSTKKYLKTIGQEVVTATQDSDGIFAESSNGDLQIAVVKIVNTLHDKLTPGNVPLQDLRSVGVLLFYRAIDGNDWLDIARGGWLGTDQCFLDFLIGRPENLMLGIKKGKRFYALESDYEEGVFYRPELKELTADSYVVTVHLAQKDILIRQFGCRLTLNPHFGITFMKSPF